METIISSADNLDAGVRSGQGNDVKRGPILKAREYYDEHAIVSPIRKFAKYAGGNQREMFNLWMKSPMKSITKYSGLPKPTGCV